MGVPDFTAVRLSASFKNIGTDRLEPYGTRTWAFPKWLVFPVSPEGIFPLYTDNTEFPVKNENDRSIREK